MKKNILKDVLPFGYGHGEYFIEFIYQAKRLLKKIIKFDNSKHLVSGNLESNQYFVEKEDKEFLASGLAGRMGQFVDFKTDHTSFSRKLYVGQTIMRGPILFNREKYFELGGLDSLRFFQGFDDHDFCARALLRVTARYGVNTSF